MLPRLKMKILIQLELRNISVNEITPQHILTVLNAFEGYLWGQICYQEDAGYIYIEEK